MAGIETRGSQADSVANQTTNEANQAAPAPDQTILLVDMNSYFATLLQQENPHLRGKPLGIVKDVGRTCIIAASKEAKKLGVKTGSNAHEARAKIPNIILLPAQFDRYLDATKRLKNLFESLSPRVYIYSLDEAFIDISDCRQNLYKDPHKFAHDIQNKIKAELGEWVTCNIGISYNHFLAKIASNVAPKGEVFEIDQENLDLVLAEVKFEDVCGIGFRLEKKLNMMGVEVPYQIRFYTQDELGNFVGPFWAKELLKMAYGQEPHHLELLHTPNSHMKSVGRSITGYKLCDDEGEIRAIIANLISEVIHKTRKMGMGGRQVGIYLMGEDQSWGEHLTLKHFINHEREMFDLLYNKLYLGWRRSFKIIKFAVRLSLLQKLGQNSLLPDWQKIEAIQIAFDKINSKYGLFTITNGNLTNRPVIRPEVTGFLGDRIFQLGG